MKISVTQFKAKCLGIIDKVQKERCKVTILKHGRKAATLSPVDDDQHIPLWGRSRETTKIKGDLLNTGETWNAEN